MKKSPEASNLRALLAWLLPLLLAMYSPQLRADSATWDPNPFNGDWNNNANWTPGGAPNGPNDTATFDVSNITNIFLSQDTEVNGIVFNSGASAFTITASPTLTLTISGVGITNNSGVTQNFVAAAGTSNNPGQFSFTNSATAGVMTAFTNDGASVSGAFGGETNFFDTSSAGFGDFTNNGGLSSNAGGGVTVFVDSANAGHASFTNNAGTVSGAQGGLTLFLNTTDASTATFTNNGASASGNGGGQIEFRDHATASSGTFVNNGGTVDGAGGGHITFDPTSSAGSPSAGFGSFINNGAAASGAQGGATVFFFTSTAANGTFTNNGGTVGEAAGGSTAFSGTSTAGSGTFTNNGGAVSGAFGGGVNFSENADAGTTSTFTNNGAPIADAGAGLTTFNDNSSAGTGTFTNNGGAVDGASNGSTIFFNTSGASGGTFTNNGGAAGAFVGSTVFNDSSTADNATITNNGSATSNGGETDFLSSSNADFSTITNNGGLGFGVTSFSDTSSAGNSTITNNGGADFDESGGLTQFSGSSTAGNSILIANSGTNGGRGGVIDFRETSSGGTARVEVFGNGELTVRLHNLPGFPNDSVTIGSLEGTGLVTLGQHNLSIGSNNLSTTFSGVIQNGPEDPGSNGSLTKIGTGTLSLTNTNTYSGGTLINAGTLIAGADGALGTGNVSLTASSVTLTLQNGATNNYIANNADLSIVSSSTVNLNFSGNPDAISALFLNGVAQAPGLYGSAASGAPNQLPEFFGTGEIMVTAIPEPSTWAMMLSGVVLLLVAQRWRVRSDRKFSIRP